MRNALVYILAVSFSLLQITPSAAQSSDEQLIKAIEQVWDDGWNRHDAKMMASVLADDADFITVGEGNLKGARRFKPTWNKHREHNSQRAPAARLRQTCVS